MNDDNFGLNTSCESTRAGIGHPVDGRRDGVIDLLIGGRYFDKYEKRDGQWKFSYKAVVADWATVDSPSRVQLDHPMLAGSYFGKPGAGDPSYEVFKLIRFGQPHYHPN